MAAKKKSSKSTDKGITKSGFIRSLPDRTPAKEVIAKAKEAGLDLNEKFVWTIQSEMRSKAKKGGKASAARKGSAAKPAASQGKKSGKQPAPITVTGSASERKMRMLILDLGMARADQAYREVKRQLDAIVRG